jgi:ribonuclease P protein component
MSVSSEHANLGSPTGLVATSCSHGTLWSLRGPEEFQKVRRKGTKVVAAPIVLHAMRSPEAHPLTVGMIVTKQVGNAVVRNRVRRHLREALRSIAHHHPGSKVVVRVLPAVLPVSHEALRSAVLASFSSLGETHA